MAEYVVRREVGREVGGPDGGVQQEREPGLREPAARRPGPQQAAVQQGSTDTVSECSVGQPNIRLATFGCPCVTLPVYMVPTEYSVFSTERSVGTEPSV